MRTHKCVVCKVHKCVIPSFAYLKFYSLYTKLSKFVDNQNLQISKNNYLIQCSKSREIWRSTWGQTVRYCLAYCSPPSCWVRPPAPFGCWWWPPRCCALGCTASGAAPGWERPGGGTPRGRWAPGAVCSPTSRPTLTVISGAEAQKDSEGGGGLRLDNRANKHTSNRLIPQVSWEPTQLMRRDYISIVLSSTTDHHFPPARGGHAH